MSLDRFAASDFELYWNAGATCIPLAKDQAALESFESNIHLNPQLMQSTCATSTNQDQATSLCSNRDDKTLNRSTLGGLGRAIVLLSG